MCGVQCAVASLSSAIGASAGSELLSGLGGVIVFGGLCKNNNVVESEREQQKAVMLDILYPSRSGIDCHDRISGLKTF